MKGRVLAIAGSDSGGGAGIQADIKTITALGGYASTVITAITAQNTLGVHDIHPIPLPHIEAQLEAVLSDIGTDTIKLGMLGRSEVAMALTERLQAERCPIVLDPVMVAKGGAALASQEAMDAIKTHLLPITTLVTPNIPEAEALTGMAIHHPDTILAAGQALLNMGPKAVLIKGGHWHGDRKVVTDTLITGSNIYTTTHPRLLSRHTHGTGCTLASALATLLAKGVALDAALDLATDYVHQAIVHAPGLGAGHGPLGHGWPLFHDAD